MAIPDHLDMIYILPVILILPMNYSLTYLKLLTKYTIRLCSKLRICGPMENKVVIYYLISSTEKFNEREPKHSLLGTVQFLNMQTFTDITLI